MNKAVGLIAQSRLCAHSQNPRQKPTCPARCTLAAKQDDETQKSPVFAIEARRSAASIFGEAKAIVKSGGKVRTFATREEAEREAKALKDAIASEFVTYVVVEKKD
jgi:hypothetical protein